MVEIRGKPHSVNQYYRAKKISTFLRLHSRKSKRLSPTTPPYEKNFAPRRPGAPPNSRRKESQDHTQCFAQWMSNFYNSPPGYQMLLYGGRGVYFYPTLIIHAAMQKTPRQGDPNVMYRKRHILYIRSLTCIDFVVHSRKQRSAPFPP